MAGRSGATRTMFAALYGGFVPYEPVVEGVEDAYGLFHARSASMGWLTGPREGASGGFWAMNEAISEANPGPEPWRVALFQVALTGRTPGGELPLQPFLACAGETMSRLGVLRLDALQLLLPEPDLDAPADATADEPFSPVTIPDVEVTTTWSLIAGRPWFAGPEPPSRIPVRVTLDGGSDPAIQRVAQLLLRWLQAANQNIYNATSFSLSDEAHLVLGPVRLDREFMTNDAHHRVTLHGTLAQWSLDALGWLAAFIADVCAKLHVDGPLLMTADRLP